MAGPFALVDGNNFYVSCERVFDPKLAVMPVGVLSNNDGCFISRSDELKALGVKMGQPLFEVRDLVRRHGVQVFSSNYTLYGDMSRRVLDCLQTFSPAVEPYSIDESFLDLGGVPDRELQDFGHDIRAQVRQWTGIPACVGIGPSKTLAKLANWVAKKRPEHRGVCIMTEKDAQDRILPLVPVENVWGIGRASAAKLAKLGVCTAADLRDMPLPQVRKALTVMGERIVCELRGLPCLDLELVPPTRQGTAVTRSFGHPVTRWEEMREALAGFAARAAEKLRHHGVVAGYAQAFMHTNRFNGGPQHSAAHGVTFPQATGDTRDIVAAAVRAGEAAWKEGFRYAKAGVVLSDLMPCDAVQSALFRSRDPDRSARLMAAMDALNRTLGSGTVRPASVPRKASWAPRAGNMSPCYTTRLKDVPEAKA